ncbi:endonuclease MutS2 [Candidatus Poribacteria bacterium]|nr:endonuclease MutS2 [Candidatus Poribacteria bacterium]
MDQHTLDILEFHRIREILEIYATSSLGKSLALSVMPETNIEKITVWQKQVTELKKLLRDGRMPLGGIRDVRSYLNELDDPVAVLGCEALLEIHSTLQAARNIKGYLHELDNSYPHLSELGRRIGSFKDLEDIIFSSIDQSGKVKNNATPKLNSIRKEIEIIRARIKSKLQSLVRSPRISRYLQSGTITIRKGRPVIPVKVRFRDNVSGIVRDQSDSGETVFVEPSSTSGKSDKLQQLIQDEKQEMFRILQEITEKLRSKKKQVWETLETLSFVDLIHAKASFSRDFEMNEPILNTRGRININKTRHPLLMYERGWGKRPVGETKEINEDPDSVVAISVRLGDDFDALIITGPNTGGKTVTLKTIGLLSLMAQAGLHIPAAEDSEMAIFSDVLADIGDEQSLEQNLSTFSSHLVQIVRILEQAADQTLILLDELGTGTDPQEGAALGIAIIDYLHKKGSRTVTTTHLNDLKTYAHSHPRTENASVEFDMQTLQPTYRLMIGAFGSSNALSIAQRLGVPKDVISRASELVTGEDARVENLVNSLQQIKSQLEKEREELATVKDESIKLKQHYENLLESMGKKTGKSIDDIIDEEERNEPVPVTMDSIQRGDMVKILSLDMEGEVVGMLRDKNKVLVLANTMKVEIKPEDLEFVDNSTPINTD